MLPDLRAHTNFRILADFYCRHNHSAGPQSRPLAQYAHDFLIVSCQIRGIGNNKSVLHNNVVLDDAEPSDSHALRNLGIR